MLPHRSCYRRPIAASAGQPYLVAAAVPAVPFVLTVSAYRRRGTILPDTFGVCRHHRSCTTGMVFPPLRRRRRPPRTTSSTQPISPPPLTPSWSDRFSSQRIGRYLGTVPVGPTRCGLKAAASSVQSFGAAGLLLPLRRVASRRAPPQLHLQSFGAVVAALLVPTINRRRCIYF